MKSYASLGRTIPLLSNYPYPIGLQDFLLSNVSRWHIWILIAFGVLTDIQEKNKLRAMFLVGHVQANPGITKFV